MLYLSHIQYLYHNQFTYQINIMYTITIHTFTIILGGVNGENGFPFNIFIFFYIYFSNTCRKFKLILILKCKSCLEVILKFRKIVEIQNKTKSIFILIFSCIFFYFSFFSSFLYFFCRFCLIFLFYFLSHFCHHVQCFFLHIKYMSFPYANSIIISFCILIINYGSCVITFSFIFLYHYYYFY